MGEKEKKGWRVSQFLGIDPANKEDDPSWLEEPPSTDLIVLDDANLGFRQQPSRWPKTLQDPQCNAWIILKLSHPAAQGDLLDYLTTHCPERVIAVVSADDLRLSNAQISRGARL